MCLVLGASADDKAANAKFAKEEGFKFPLICDTTLAVSVAYGAAKDAAAGVSSRMAVLIDRDGKVAKVWPKVDARTFPETALKELPEPPPFRESTLDRSKYCRFSEDELHYRSGPYPMPASMIKALPEPWGEPKRVEVLHSPGQRVRRYHQDGLLGQ